MPNLSVTFVSTNPADGPGTTQSLSVPHGTRQFNLTEIFPSRLTGNLVWQIQNLTDLPVKVTVTPKDAAGNPISNSETLYVPPDTASADLPTHPAAASYFLEADVNQRVQKPAQTPQPLAPAASGSGAGMWMLLILLVVLGYYMWARRS